MPTIIRPHMGGFQISGARLSYPHLFEPKAVASRGQQPAPGARKTYSCQLLLDPGTDTSELVAAMTAVANEAFPEGLPQGFNWPIFETLKKYPDQAEKIPAGTISLTCKRQDKQGKPATLNGSGAEITDPGALYPGCRVGAYITVYAYNNVARGVNCGLEMVLYEGPGDHLDSRLSAQQMMAGMTGGIPDEGRAAPPQPAANPGAAMPGQTAAAPGGPSLPGQTAAAQPQAQANNVVALPGAAAGAGVAQQPAAAEASNINPLTGKPYPGS